MLKKIIAVLVLVGTVIGVSGMIGARSTTSYWFPPKAVHQMIRTTRNYASVTGHYANVGIDFVVRHTGN